MRSEAPGSSGAIVSSRSPSTSASSVGRGTPAGTCRWVASCAPRRAGARNGPSRLNPSGSAPSTGASGRQALTRSAKAVSSSRGAVTAVGRNEVTPRRSSRRAMPSSAARSPIASWPPQPWTWTSTNPGARYGPSSSASASTTTAAIRPSSIVIRPAATRSSRTSRPRAVLAGPAVKVRSSLRHEWPPRSPRPTSRARRSRSRPPRARSCGPVVAAHRGWARAGGRWPPRSRPR